MKKIICLLLAGAMVFSCVSCGTESTVDATFACKACGEAIESGAKFCPSCGTMTASECKECGEAVEPDAKFCFNCGALTGETAETPTEVPTDAPVDDTTDVPTEDITNEPTGVPTDVPTEDPTAAPTARPTATAKPTVTPKPTATAKPTATPKPTATAKPTATPKPKPTATPNPYTTVNVPKLEQNSKTMTAATVKTYSGNITVAGQTDTYTYTAPRDGWYTFQLSEIKSGIRFRFYIYDSLKNTIEYHDYAKNYTYFSVKLSAGETYTIIIKEFEGKSSYKLSVGEQNPTIDVSAYSQIIDSLVYEEQPNYYTYTPQVSGNYAFELSEVKAGVRVQFYIRDSLGYALDYHDFAANGTVLTANLESGKTYRIIIVQYDELGSYTLNIGKRKINVEISTNYIVNDNIEFKEQTLGYTLAVDKSGNYSLSFSNMKSGMRMQVYVFNYLDEKIAYDDFCYNGDSIKLNNLQAGNEYAIRIYQETSTGSYTMTVNTLSLSE